MDSEICCFVRRKPEEVYGVLHISLMTSITIMGESAGASSIMHHLTARGGQNVTLPFQKAILQSTAFFPQYVLS
jgi:Carboxylesterase family